MGAAGIFADDELPGKGEEDAETEDFQRMLPAADGRPQDRPIQPGQSRGMKRTVTAASARKCAKRNTSRLVLSIGYIHSLSQFGTNRPSGSTYQVR